MSVYTLESDPLVVKGIFATEQLRRARAQEEQELIEQLQRPHEEQELTGLWVFSPSSLSLVEYDSAYDVAARWQQVFAHVILGCDEQNGTLDQLLADIERIKDVEASEHKPTPAAIALAKQLIGEVKSLVHFDPPLGEVDYYFGELGIEWRSDDRILRLTCFRDPNTPARIDYGTMSATTPGEYRSVPVATARDLAGRLDWLSGQSAEGRHARA